MSVTHTISNLVKEPVIKKENVVIQPPISSSSSSGNTSNENTTINDEKGPVNMVNRIPHTYSSFLKPDVLPVHNKPTHVTVVPTAVPVPVPVERVNQPLLQYKSSPQGLLNNDNENIADMDLDKLLDQVTVKMNELSSLVFKLIKANLCSNNVQRLCEELLNNIELWRKKVGAEATEIKNLIIQQTKLFYPIVFDKNNEIYRMKQQNWRKNMDSPFHRVEVDIKTISLSSLNPTLKPVSEGQLIYFPNKNRRGIIKKQQVDITSIPIPPLNPNPSLNPNPNTNSENLESIVTMEVERGVNLNLGKDVNDQVIEPNNNEMDLQVDDNLLDIVNFDVSVEGNVTVIPPNVTSPSTSTVQQQSLPVNTLKNIDLPEDYTILIMQFIQQYNYSNGFMSVNAHYTRECQILMTGFMEFIKDSLNDDKHQYRESIYTVINCVHLFMIQCNTLIVIQQSTIKNYILNSIRYLKELHRLVDQNQYAVQHHHSRHFNGSNIQLPNPPPKKTVETLF